MTTTETPGNAAPASRPRLEKHDHRVPHRSLAYGGNGDEVEIFVRECVPKNMRGLPVVLMLHGGVYPSVPDFDLPYRDYSWMEAIADAGFHVFIMDFVGYGYSTRLALSDDGEPAEARYQVLRSPQSEWADMAAVVSFVRRHTGAERINLVGWSGGGARGGGFASLHPDLVDRMVLLAPAYGKETNDEALDAPGLAGTPLRLTAREKFEANWLRQVIDPAQLEDGIRDLVWDVNMLADPVGATRDPPAIRGPNLSLASITRGWNAGMAGRVKAPTLLIAAEYDADVPPPRVRELYDDLGSGRKALAQIDGTSHYVPWETRRALLHRLTIGWLRDESVADEGLQRETFPAEAR